MSKKESEWENDFDKRFVKNGWDILFPGEKGKPEPFPLEHFHPKKEEIKTFIRSLLSKREAEIADKINSFPLSDSMFFDENNWKAGYKALEEFKNYLIK